MYVYSSLHVVLHFTNKINIIGGKERRVWGQSKCTYVLNESLLLLKAGFSCIFNCIHASTTSSRGRNFLTSLLQPCDLYSHCSSKMFSTQAALKMFFFLFLSSAWYIFCLLRIISVFSPSIHYSFMSLSISCGVCRSHSNFMVSEFPQCCS